MCRHAHTQVRICLSLTSHLQSSLFQTLIELTWAHYLWVFRSVLASTACVRVKWKCWISLWHSIVSQTLHAPSGLSDSLWERDYFWHANKNLGRTFFLHSSSLSFLSSQTCRLRKMLNHLLSSSSSLGLCDALTEFFRFHLKKQLL